MTPSLRRMPAFLAREVLQTVQRPRRLIRMTDRQAWRGLAFRLSSPDRRAVQSECGLHRRLYDTYDDYVEHQRSKLSLLDLDAYNTELRRSLRARLECLPVDWAAKSVLCLGARMGAEVLAFHDLGAFAIGIDLEPGPRNELVLPGDFHHLQFPAACLDVVYTNSLDHALDLEALVTEVHRVLTPCGSAVIEPAEAGDLAGGSWEASGWDDIEAVVALFETNFELRSRQPVEFPATHAEQLFFSVRPT